VYNNKLIKEMAKTQYAVAVWLSTHDNDAMLQQYIANTQGSHLSSFVKDSGLSNSNGDFIEAVCYNSRMDMFDIIDKVSYAKYFRSECVKMLYPQQFSDYRSLIFVYGRNGREGIIHPQLFSHYEFITILGTLYYAGRIAFDIPHKP